ncbi:MAG: hypothetical protein IPL61_36890 [Myxococcales bacterium]|nr:hypothetical protein [Myxococcales bacterium]
MATNRKASLTKRQRELDQKDGVRDREVRRAERLTRLAERVAAGVVGAPIEAEPPIEDRRTPEPPPFLDEIAS